MLMYAKLRAQDFIGDSQFSGFVHLLLAAIERPGCGQMMLSDWCQSHLPCSGGLPKSEFLCGGTVQVYDVRDLAQNCADMTLKDFASGRAGVTADCRLR
jgi:hypothetical protein